MTETDGPTPASRYRLRRWWWLFAVAGSERRCSWGRPVPSVCVMLPVFPAQPAAMNGRPEVGPAAGAGRIRL